MTESKKKNNRKRIPAWFYLVLIILPFLFIVLIELTLVLFDYGKNYEEWVSIDGEYEILNPDIAHKYFSGLKNIPFSTESFLLKNKPDNSFRVIVLGASSAAGYPYQNSGSFTKYVRKALESVAPLNKIEVANISMAAINSYTIADLMPGIINKNPDLILIYLGHNEFYGALGVGSVHSGFNSALITHLSLQLKEFRTYQLIQNLISFVISSNNGKTASTDQTLMSQIAREKLIELNSEKFAMGVEQFRTNLTEILQICSQDNIPVIIGSLASNLKDLQPFSSVASKEYGTAEEVYNKGRQFLKNGLAFKADSLFRLAKDLDALRFRAPETFNDIILKLARRYNFITADIDSALNCSSPDNIVGDNLMVDHLHPNLLGYQIIGKIFVSEIVEHDLIIADKENFNIDEIDLKVKSEYNFTEYDSILAEYKIQKLKSDWPFVTESHRKDFGISPGNTIESRTAYEVFIGKLSRLEARLKLSYKYRDLRDYGKLVKEVSAMIDEFPSEIRKSYPFINHLIENQSFQNAGSLLKASYRKAPDEYNTKWLGIMYMSNGDYENAFRFLTESNNIIKDDPQVLFNLAGVFLHKKDYKRSLELINRCLQISPNYKNADILQAQLKKKLRN